MTIEEKTFARKKFDEKSLAAYGFEKTDEGYVYAVDFLGGDFKAEIIVDNSGVITGKVFDNMNDEEYLQLRNETYDSAFVNEVRAAYEEILADIAEKCCFETYFAADQSNRLTDAINVKYGVIPDFPWSKDPHETSGVFRHKEGGKWFGLIMNIKRSAVTKEDDDALVDVMNLKRAPSQENSKGIYDAYHMNHKLWISVLLDDTLTDDEIMGLIDKSYKLTKGKK
ncbi:MAG: MmcQ/YjbR family DNA-binding protein [Clostridia bacterium]|nr:MmcQ/YjbR family DNA-binding protein [Clostridia bacterium]